MAIMAGDQPSSMVGQPSTNLDPQIPTTNNNILSLDFSRLLKPSTINNQMQMEPIPFKRATFLHDQPFVKFTKIEVDRMNIIEGLQYAVLGKFSYGWHDLQELHKLIPVQCGIKGDCNIGLLRDKLVLIRLTLREDFQKITSKSTYYIKAKDGFEYQMRQLIYDKNFKVGEETPMAMAWISFPQLLLTYFVKECLFSLASAVGIPQQLDLATINKTRPSCARVKVLINLIAYLPKKMRMDIEDEATGVARTEWVKIQYDFIPKYYKECKLQGHDMMDCWRLHPELMDRKTDDKQASTEVQSKKDIVSEHHGTFASRSNQNGPGLFVSTGKLGNMQGNAREQWKEVRDNRTYKGVPQKKDQEAARKDSVSVNQKEMQQMQCGNKFALLERACAHFFLAVFIPHEIRPHQLEFASEGFISPSVKNVNSPVHKSGSIQSVAIVASAAANLKEPVDRVDRVKDQNVVAPAVVKQQ